MGHANSDKLLGPNKPPAVLGGSTGFIIKFPGLANQGKEKLPGKPLPAPTWEAAHHFRGKVVQLLTPLPTPWEALVCSSMTPEPRHKKRGKVWAHQAEFRGWCCLETAEEGNHCIIPEPFTWPEAKHCAGVLHFMGAFKMRKKKRKKKRADVILKEENVAPKPGNPEVA